MNFTSKSQKCPSGLLVRIWSMYCILEVQKVWQLLGESVLCRWNSEIDVLINSLASALRSVLVALAVAATLPMINAYGILVTNALCAVLVWISFVYVIVLKKRVKKEKADNDILIVGYATSLSMVTR